MKQYITNKQFKDLSKEGQEKYKQWWKPRLGDIVWNGQHKPEGIDAITIGNASMLKDWQTNKLSININPLPNIGQMMEYLMENYHGTGKSISFDLNEMEQDRICDTLWDYVKRLLEK